MQEREDVIEERDKDEMPDSINKHEGEGDGKFHKVRSKNTHLTPKKKKRR